MQLIQIDNVVVAGSHDLAYATFLAQELNEAGKLVLYVYTGIFNKEGGAWKIVHAQKSLALDV